MAFEAKNYESLLGCEGLSDTLLQNHFTLYQGYVKNTNALVELLASKTAGTPEHAELQRRFGWEFNGMRLHELFFQNMRKGGGGIAPAELSGLVDGFAAIGGMRGIGWVVMTYDPVSGQTFNVWINEHDVGHLAGCVPLLVMDVFEHAYMVDYGLKRADYIAAFMRLVDWDVVAARLNQAKSHTP